MGAQCCFTNSAKLALFELRHFVVLAEQGSEAYWKILILDFFFSFLVYSMYVQNARKV